MTAPSSIRFTAAGFSALKSLVTITGKSRSAIVSEALVAMHNKSAPLAPIRLRILNPAEILTLQSEIATIENLHNDNRRRIKIRNADKNATEKIIKAVEKIDAEIAELQNLRLKIGKQAQLSDSITNDDIRRLRGVIKTRTNEFQKLKAQEHDATPFLESELKILTALIL